MNERIRKLAEQAGAEFFQDTGVVVKRDGFFESVEFENHKNLDLEKFAELIVRECADIIQNPGSYEETYLSTAGHTIKQHFGVEE